MSKATTTGQVETLEEAQAWCDQINAGREKNWEPGDAVDPRTFTFRNVNRVMRSYSAVKI